ncbi:RNA polymerase sigma factor SigZ [Psychromonas aquimarina]|uniref:RNA polymerase sigma factor SigZ n=1 Tax=Psychromonas aquimarina TaxID=444919 RepID=UPI00040CF392|nr:RNA polymerase sigma factor SigZ [Psychromonas aquimarina]
MNVETIWPEYQAGLKAFLYKNVSNPDDVEDLLQEILIKTYQNLNTVKENTKVKSWLFQIAGNTLIDFYRSRAKGADITQEILWYAQPDKNVFQQLSLCILPFINALPEEEAKLLTAVEIDGLSQKAYAEKIGVKYSTLKSRVQKSRQMLYGLFSDCCELSIDHKGNLMDFQAKRKNCSSC